ncbi:hypothetical protein E2562_012080 [Oryza meyeriana var. granulata]|uniref:Uncharacterized protein n=1 Tax=Oryza meyeriana var. granulata TaxID=110450 RepID=A0A6G1F7C8_9ORYZ|nr:hypothetical protein E2562_012080 [Oryza meyeriana var. granulata]
MSLLKLLREWIGLLLCELNDFWVKPEISSSVLVTSTVESGEERGIAVFLEIVIVACVSWEKGTVAYVFLLKGTEAYVFLVKGTEAYVFLEMETNVCLEMIYVEEICDILVMVILVHDLETGDGGEMVISGAQKVEISSEHEIYDEVTGIDILVLMVIFWNMVTSAWRPKRYFWENAFVEKKNV